MRCDINNPDRYKYLDSLLERLEGLSETLGGLRSCGEIIIGCRHLKLLDLAVEADDISTIQGIQDTVPDVSDGEDIPADGASLPRRRVKRELSCPEVQTGEVDLGLWPVLQAEIETPLGNADRSLAGPLCVAGVHSCFEGCEGFIHARLYLLRNVAPPPVSLPGIVHVVDRGRGCIPVPRLCRVEGLERTAVKITESVR